MGINPFYFCVLQTKYFISVFTPVRPPQDFISRVGVWVTRIFTRDFLNTNSRVRDY